MPNDEQLAELSESLNAAGKQDKANSAELREYEIYLGALDEIMTFDESNESLYREILDKMVIYVICHRGILCHIGRLWGYLQISVYRLRNCAS